ncbi:FAD/NAD(P)-binding protein [Streptomyces sp. NPDC088785]|uniref:FAD/NAD(P)-binding protein n=1 Tax=Streptomyces sp. NPDC088785 TaxID=3365897 RepID=UPI0037F8B6CD
MSTPTHLSIAVVGAGASGIMTTLRLLQHHRARSRGTLTIHLIDRAERPGLGVAYGTPLRDHILNMQAKTMSLYPGDPDHFLRALPGLLADDPPASAPPATATDHPDAEALAASYVPRRVYGAYLARCLTDALTATAGSGARVEYHRREAVRLAPAPTGVQVDTEGPGPAVPACTHAVLCVGDLPPTSYRYLLGHPHYAPSPWVDGFPDAVPEDAAVGVIGTGLTAVDALLSLRAAGHRGPLYAFARRRGWPAVQPSRLRPHTPYLLTARAVHALGEDVPLARFAGLLRDELTDRVGRDEVHDLLSADRGDVVPTLLADLARARQPRPHWYEVLDATSPLAPDIWRRARFADKARFLRAHMGRWAVLRHPMPVPNARFLADLLSSGRLRTLRGTYDIRPATDGGFDVLRRTHSGTAVHHPTYLVNASGPGTSAWTLESDLVKDCLHQGLLSPHPLGGIDVDPTSMRVRGADGRHNDRVLFLGPLTNGVHFYTNAIETNLANADLAARWITR